MSFNIHPYCILYTYTIMKYIGGRQIYLGTFSLEESNERLKLANDMIKQWTSSTDSTTHPTLDWAKAELERLNIRKIVPNAGSHARKMKSVANGSSGDGVKKAFVYVSGTIGTM